MKEEIKSARLVIQSERGTRPGSGLVGMLVRGKEESEFMFSEAATSWMGRRKSRQVYKKKNVALSLPPHPRGRAERASPLAQHPPARRAGRDVLEGRRGHAPC